MAIVQISKIQVRTGSIDELPQLSVGELGWASDAKRLFIGNEPNVAGPEPDNTEILTSGSPIPPAGPNGAIQFNDNGVIGGSNAFIFQTSTDSLALAGNVLTLQNATSDLGNSTNRWRDAYIANAINIGSSNTLIYANGNSVVISNLYVSNIEFGDDLTLDGNLTVGGNIYGNLKNNDTTLVIQPNRIDFGINNQPNAISMTRSGPTSTTTFNGNVIITNGINVSGDAVFSSVTDLVVSSPMIDLGTGPNGQPLSTDDGKDRGILLHTYGSNGAGGPDLLHFMGWKNSGNTVLREFQLGTGTVTDNIINITDFSNVRAGNFLGNLVGNTASLASNLLVSGNVVGAANTYYFGNGAFLTGVVSSYSNAEVANYIAVFNGNILANNIEVTGNLIIDKDIIHEGNIINDGNLNVSGNITSNSAVITDLVQSLTGDITLKAIGTNNHIYLDPSPGGWTDAGNSRIANLILIPEDDQDAASKYYVDQLAQGIKPKVPCILGTTTFLPGTIVYYNGPANDGVGSTLTITPAITTLDGLPLTIGMRVLIKDQIDTFQNGIYEVTSIGADTVLTRPADAWNNVEWPDGSFVFVEEGVEQEKTGWVLVTDIVTVGISPMVFLQISAPGTYNAGTGLDLNGTTFSIANTTVISGSYGSGALRKLPVLVVNDQGQLTDVSLDDIEAAGANWQVQFNNGDLFDGSSKFTFTEPTGNLAIVGNVSATGQVTGSTLSGALVTPFQPNITSVGTLSALNVNGTVTGLFFSGDGGQLTNITGSNISGTVANATYAITASSANVATTAGTVTSAAQPNITSLGTLSSLSVSGSVGAGSGNFGAVSANTIQGNIISPLVRTSALSTGDQGTAGTITGIWTLTGSSRMEATYADLGERYESDHAYEPGTVMMIGGEKEVTIATKEGMYRLAGVVSTDPAYVLNSMIGNSVIIALAGRVPCKVVGKIEKGDLLTISDIPGVATRATEMNSLCVIGRSLGNYNSDKVGKIEIKVDRG